MSNPIVLVEIDENSVVRVFQDGAVHVVTIDRRADPAAVLWPPADQFPDMLAVIGDLPLMSPDDDDALESARAAIRRIRSGLTVVARGPAVLNKIGESA